MKHTQLNTVHESRALTRSEIKKEMKRRRGFTFASYSRLVRRSRGAITRLADGEIGGALRQKFLRFFAFTEIEIPYRPKRSKYSRRKAA